MDLTEKQWERMEHLFVEATTSNRGRPRQPARGILNGVPWILRTEATWKDMPGRYPPYQTCHRRFQQWVSVGIFQNLSIDSSFIKEKPKNLIGDKAYYSDPLETQLLKDYGIEVIAPHRRNRKSKKTQDGRKLRRYVRRWKIERLFSWRKITGVF